MRFLDIGRFSEAERNGRCTVSTKANYFKPNVFIIQSTDRRRPSCMGNRQSGEEKMSRNKSIIRSSSTGSYPYPRTHTTLMVIPSKRPPTSPSSVVSGTSSALSTTSSNRISNLRRRPPLNRACPPIPESKSNESIMSHASRISDKQIKAAAAAAAAAAAETSNDLVIENRNVVNVLHCLDSNLNISSCQPKPTKKKAKMSSSNATPRSPLMSVAHSVKNKLTKFTHLGRHSESSASASSSSASSTSNIKTSQSFSGIRQPKSIPKRIDQNANRVIKSSSMEVPPSTSKTVIPQDTKLLKDDKIEEMSEAGLIPKHEIATPPSIIEHVSVKLEEDVLVVTKEFDQKYPGQKRSASPDPPLLLVETFEIQSPAKVDVIQMVKYDANANPNPEEEHQKMTENVLRIEQCVEEAEAEGDKAEDKFSSANEINENQMTSEVNENHQEMTNNKKQFDVEDEAVKAAKSKSPERTKSPEKYILMVKTPEALRKHRTLTIGEKDPNDFESKKEEEEKKKKIKRSKPVKSPSMPERVTSPDRFILTVKTPETLRRHRTFTIGDRDPNVKSIEEKEKVTKNKSKNRPIRSPSMPERIKSPERFILTVKTPEALRKHRTLTIGTKDESEVLISSKSIEKSVKKVKPKRSPSMPERMTSPDKYVLTVKTPEALRKHRTLVIGEKVEENPIDIDFEKNVKKVQKPVKSPSAPERVASPEKYVLMVKTPEALRKHRTLTIGEREAAIEGDDDKIQITKIETVKFKEVVQKEIITEEPTKFYLKIKTPEALRRHQTFTIRDKSPEQIENERKEVKISKSKSDAHVSRQTQNVKVLKKQKSEPEKFVSPERFILTVRTPEALRKHRTLTIGQKSDDPSEDVTNTIASSKIENLENVAKKTLKKTDVVEKKEVEEGGTKFVMVIKTPEALRRHHTFTIGDRPKSPDYPFIEDGELTEPIATIGPPAERRRKEEEKIRKKQEWEEYDKPQEKFILKTTSTTPLAARKYQTFLVENKQENLNEKLPTSISADAEIGRKRKTVQRSESTDSKKHSYLRRLQFEFFRGRSRERKNEHQDEKKKRQKSLDERKPRSAQKYILSTTTPIMMRKYQTFSIVDNNVENPSSSDYNIESITASYQPKTNREKEEIKTSDFYSITATTPIAKRRNLINSDASTTKQTSFDDEKSPTCVESRHLFVMGGRKSTTPRLEDRTLLRLEPLDRSQSDRAELQEERKSTLSGDLTSPDEDIPMDTNLTPTAGEEDAPILSRRIGEMMLTSPIEEEPEGLTSMSLSLKSPLSENGPHQQRAAPVFTPPSPPPITSLVMKSTSITSSDASTNTSASKSKKPNQLAINPMHVVELKKSTTNSDPSKSVLMDYDGSKSKQKKDQKIASRSLRNAGKMLTPSFLRKDRKNEKKNYAKTTMTGRQHISEKLERKAPLAEGESSVVANSPLVENLPITFEKWSMKSPRQSAKNFSETIVEEVASSPPRQFQFGGLDANANNTCPSSNNSELHQHQTIIGISHQSAVSQQDTGLIDDDILDQPMLVGDTFSHSSSIDCISSHQKMSESIISIDRSSMAVDIRNSTNGKGQNSSTNITKQIDAGLCEVEDIKSQLKRLNKLVNEIGVTNFEEEIIRLRRENEQLRRQLAERDATISALRSHPATTILT